MHNYWALFILALLCRLPSSCDAQYSWDWRDPNDLNIVDLGDNKVIAYNMLGLGLVILLDKKEHRDSTLLWSASAANYYEYRRDPLSKLFVVEGRVGRPMRKYLSWGAGGRLNFAYGEGRHTTGIGTFLWFSWHIVHQKKWRITYDNGVGPNYFLDPFPNGGTRFNFTTHYGLEFAFKINERWLSMQFTNTHISNANIKGAARNPALDAIGIQLGLTF